jgi:DNA-binding response OmpR family regulator
MQVLVVDDDDDLRTMLRTLLVRNGYEVIEASNGEDAINLATGLNAPRLILLDWMMPGLDGLAVCKVLRHTPAPFRYIILLTAVTGDKKNVAKAVEAGFNDYVEKPYFPEELLERVKVGETLVNLYGGLVQRLQGIGADMEQIRLSIGQPIDNVAQDLLE